MTKKKEPQMAHTAEQDLISEIESIIDDASESVSEDELAKREQAANQVVENVRERVSRRERA